MELLEEMDQAKPFYSNVSVDCFRLMKDRSWWIKKEIGAIIEEPGFLKQYSGKQNLRLLASMSGKENIDIEKALKVVGLECAGRKKLESILWG